MTQKKRVDGCTVVDLFAGAGALTHGFIMEGFHVAAGFDADKACHYPYEHNNPGAKFVNARIEDTTPYDISAFYPSEHIKILVGCAPCQPFSAYTRRQTKHESWSLIHEFSQLIEDIQPDIVSMENVPRLKSYDGGSVFGDFLQMLGHNEYYVKWDDRVYAPSYGVPQQRYRLILIASKLGPIEFLRAARTPGNFRSVRDAVGGLDPIQAGEVSLHDPLHRSMRLSPTNLSRIRASRPGGTWADWPDDLRAPCHTRSTGRWYHNVYGRMSWDELAPTITTQCYGFGNGRFGHPEQDRAISLREAALLQTFPADYTFFGDGEPCQITTVSRLIGNAVPVALARMVAKSIRLHIFKHRGWLWRKPPMAKRERQCQN